MLSALCHDYDRHLITRLYSNSLQFIFHIEYINIPNSTYYKPEDNFDLESRQIGQGKIND
ncbi:MAG: hypothetical protein ACI88A_000460 [Paraglaciecola sp.]|jgi:hypothetical protein